MKNPNWLLPICKEHNTTLVDLGGKIGKSKQYLSELGRGHIRLSYDMAVKIAEALDTTPDALFLPTESSETGYEKATGTDGRSLT